MAERVVTVGSTSGLHARPAALFAEKVNEVMGQKNLTAVTIAGEGSQEAFDASSILALMGLGAAHGARVVLRAEGPDAETALDELAQMVETNHDAQS